ncbi:MAG: LON peptidase substrate-binding domain-containing protein, partial [candidate division NC10 bacterium]
MSESRNGKDLTIPDLLGVLPLRGTVLFPHAVIPLGAGRPSSVRLIEEAVQSGQVVGAVMQRDPSEDSPRAAGLHPVGTVMTIHKALKQPDGTVRLVVQGLQRFRIVEMIQEAPYFRARIESLPDPAGPAATLELEALARSTTSLFQKVVSLSPTLPDELAQLAATAEGPGALADLIAASLLSLPTALKQQLLETIDVTQRLQTLAA